MRATTFNNERLSFHRKMADAYHDFLTYTFVQNKGNIDLHRGLAEARNKFLSSYFIESENNPVPSWFPDAAKKRYKGSSRRYLLGDYYSEAALREIGNLQWKSIYDQRMRLSKNCAKLNTLMAHQ
jgi:hypothetical protein